MSLDRPGRTPDPTAVEFLRRWAATLSFPSVEVFLLGDHLLVRDSGELVASGSVLAGPVAPPEAY
jgi:hypothetical protein